MLRLFAAAVALAMLASPGEAAPKAAVFPFELVIPAKEEDFFMGTAKLSPAETGRLKLAYDEFIKLMTAGGAIESVDLAPLAALIEAKSPLHDCNGCEVDISRKAGAELAYLVVIEKASDTMLNLQIFEIDVGKGAVARSPSAVVQGNTDDGWLGGIRWIVKNRLLAKKEAAR